MKADACRTKIGPTSKAVQEQLGVGELDFGLLLADMAWKRSWVAPSLADSSMKTISCPMRWAFLSDGQLLRSQIRMASSSRSMARRSGFAPRGQVAQDAPGLRLAEKGLRCSEMTNASTPLRTPDGRYIVVRGAPQSRIDLDPRGPALLVDLTREGAMNGVIQ